MAPNTPNSLTSIDTPQSSKDNKLVNTDVKCLFDPKEEKAACGVGFVVNIDGIASNKVIFQF